ncbi:Uncharacterised protein [Plesiomonas shigelloides]|nr:Uncharacterised protein [Plesiomonas shigelloides]
MDAASYFEATPFSRMLDGSYLSLVKINKHD